MAYLVPKSAGYDCVIQRDHCRELLVFWCFGVYKIIAMIANNKNNLYIFGISKLSISWWHWLSAIPLMDLYNYTRLMDGSCHQQAMRVRVDIFGVTKVIYASPQGIHRQAAFDFQ
ncbi:hypothetical protein O0I10_011495 [Lichtheimia ornata]|uniref:Uncharacterized protein n=1 Tax=Lichtheimia ornata TaxID=688661 RepID=A0AAD7XWP0_9FUNG|nr:uncharacterized protein O0I10_011495 [Lichtheimia ornata]KAJ8652822.1 hypothetical protein O0I10_011495 [Lichtheimia ornata]